MLTRWLTEPLLDPQASIFFTTAMPSITLPKHHCKPGEICQFMSATLSQRPASTDPSTLGWHLDAERSLQKGSKEHAVNGLSGEAEISGCHYPSSCLLSGNEWSGSDAADVLVCAGACSKPLQELVAEMQTEDQ